MIESLRTRQMAFFRFAAPSGFPRGAEARYKEYSCKSPCKRKSYETTCENTVSRYETLVSEAVFLHRRPKTEFMTGFAGQPSNKPQAHALCWGSHERANDLMINISNGLR